MPEPTVDHLSTNDQLSLLSPISCFTPPPLVQQIQQPSHLHLHQQEDEQQHEQQQPTLHNLATTPSASIAVLERNWDISDDASVDQQEPPGTADLETVDDDGGAVDQDAEESDANTDQQVLDNRPTDDQPDEENNANDASSSSSDSRSEVTAGEDEVRDEAEDDDEAEDSNENNENISEIEEIELDSTATDEAMTDISTNANASDNQAKKQQPAAKDAKQKVTIESLNAFDVLKYYEILN